MKQENYLRVGRIINTHGLKGELKIQVITDSPQERFAPQTRLYLHQPQGSTYLPVEVQKARPQLKFWLVQLNQITDLTTAEKYKNWELMIVQADLPPLSEKQYYYHQILGITVYDQKRGYLGKVQDIMALGPNDVWVVQDQVGSEILIPILPTVLLQVDVQEQTAQVALPAGLIDED
ncbi:ribosome maturation factor RimM [Lactobacillus sp. DCY120]|uniref:Ribosome maturation factor RimM n=1 Tax=Bombilactobacillus apium TaxID=2675299 RepID=A0A850RE39_9LACO|nr:ribosome maturation factor RimM [Bombilactobacillus apium]NVY96988.1 ribosome maturation factor RimM [Bombilactobacillus apium]